MNEKEERMRFSFFFSNKSLTLLPVLASMPKLALEMCAGGGDINFDSEPNGAILS